MSAIRLTCLLITTYAASTSLAQFDLSWYTIDSGGVTFATGGSFELGATIGQHDAGPTMTGGSFELTGGFWQPFTLVAPCPGDLNGDGLVNQLDLNLLLAAFGTCPGDAGYDPAAGNLAGDACVDQLDLNIVLAGFGSPCP